MEGGLWRGGLTMGVLYLWITTSLVSGTKPVQETRQVIQRQQKRSQLLLRTSGIKGMELKRKEKMRCGPGRVLHRSLVGVGWGGRPDWFRS